MDEARRFTPTHVGNTISIADGPAHTVHPHARGEYPVYRHHDALTPYRFTPTHVGNTLENHAEFGRSRPAALRFFFRWLRSVTRARPSKSVSIRLLSPYWR